MVCEGAMMIDPITDLREKQTREQVSLEQNEFQSLVLEDTRAMIITSQQVVIYATDAASRLFGYGAGYFQQIKPQLKTLIPERFHARHDQHFKGYFDRPEPRPMGRRVRGETAMPTHFIGLKRTGDEFPVEIALGELKMHRGEECIVILLSESRTGD